MLTILGAVAEMEREIPTSFEKYYPLWKNGELTATDFAKIMDISRPTLYKYIEVHQNEKSN